MTEVHPNVNFPRVVAFACTSIIHGLRLLSGADQTTLGPRNEYDLTAAEARLIDAFRALSLDYPGGFLRMIVDMSEAGDMQYSYLRAYEYEHLRTLLPTMFFR